MRFGLLAAATALVCTAAPAMAATLVEVEPNNSFATAQRLSDLTLVFGNGDSVTGSAEGTGIVDYFRIDVVDNYCSASTACLLFASTLVPGASVSIFDAAGSLISFRSSSFESATVVKGTYFAGVEGVAGQTNRNYVLRTNLTYALPEPASWALMIAGVGLVGAATRRERRRVSVHVG